MYEKMHNVIRWQKSVDMFVDEFDVCASLWGPLHTVGAACVCLLHNLGAPGIHSERSESSLTCPCRLSGARICKLQCFTRPKSAMVSQCFRLRWPHCPPMQDRRQEKNSRLRMRGKGPPKKGACARVCVHATFGAIVRFFRFSALCCCVLRLFRTPGEWQYCRRCCGSDRGHGVSVGFAMPDSHTCCSVLAFDYRRRGQARGTQEEEINCWRCASNAVFLNISGLLKMTSV